jgi:hypothetical protein
MINPVFDKVLQKDEYDADKPESISQKTPEPENPHSGSVWLIMKVEYKIFNWFF